MSPISAAGRRHPPAPGLGFLPSHLSLGVEIGAAIAGTVFLALSSWIELPMVPVPMTMQTFAVTLVGAVFGARLGTLTVLAWLAEAAVGMPVLAGGGGFAHFMGPTAGYLLSFPLVAAAIGWCADRGWLGGRPLRALGAMIVANAAILAIGATWLATLIGVRAAWAHGVLPFLLGGVLKSALAAALLQAAHRASQGVTSRE